MTRTLILFSYIAGWCIAPALAQVKQPPVAQAEGETEVHPLAAELRTWSDLTGKFRVDASLVELKDGKVTLQRGDGKAIVVELAKLAKEDRDYIRSEMRRRKAVKPATPVEPKPHKDPEAQLSTNDRGLGVMPLAQPRVFVHVEGMPAPKPEECVRNRWTDPQRDPQQLVTAEIERLKTADVSHLAWEKNLGYPLVRVETHHVVVHAQLPAAEARNVGLALEGLKVHLQQLTGNMVLTPLRPDQDELVIVFGKPQYLRLLKVFEDAYRGKLGDGWHLMPELAGSRVGRTSFFYQPEAADPPAHMAVWLTANASIRDLCQGREPAWFSTGFSSYCENVVLRKNLVHPVDYELKKLQIGPDWSQEVKKLAMAGALRPWEEMITKELRDYELVHHVEAYAMVSYLLQSDPQKFLDLTEKFAKGVNSREALTEVYGQSIEKTQQQWAQWLLR